MYRIGVDVGGTFTDLVAVDGRGTLTVAKSVSTPSDQSEGFLEGLGLLAARLATNVQTMLGQTEVIVHGTTVATNALLERKGARTGMLATEGHRDIIEMREGLKDDRYNLRMPPPEPLADRSRIVGVRERMRADGSVEVPLDAKSLRAAVAKLKQDGVEAVAVTFLHSYRNPKHERIAGDALARAMPGVYLSLSCDVLPQIKEYERSWTTLVNAYVGPLLSRYLTRLSMRLQDAGFRGDLLIMQSHGGVAPVAESARIAAGAVLSGPAGGVAAGRVVAKITVRTERARPSSGRANAGGEGSAPTQTGRYDDLITFDMGGTSTDICLLKNGEPQLTGEKRVGVARVALPGIDMHTLGAGGGSIARVGRDGILRVGPESAGAAPGPASYGKGGSEATVTDANVVLGYLDPGNFLGGRIKLDARAANRAVGRVAKGLGVDESAAAHGVWRVVNANMADGIRIVSVRRGIDPRGYSLVSFGGAAGLHISAVARQLGISRVIVPAFAPVLSAWGMLGTDMRYEMVRSHVSEAGGMTSASLARLFEELEAEGRKRLGAFSGDVHVRRSLDMRYGEQIFEITVPLDEYPHLLDESYIRPVGAGLKPAPTTSGSARTRSPGGDLVTEAVARFHARHEELFAYSAPGQEVVIVNVRVAVVGVLPDISGTDMPAIRPAKQRRPSPRGRRKAFVQGWAEVPVYAMASLAPGDAVRGPAIVESDMTTILALENDVTRVLKNGWLEMTVGQ